MPSGDGNGGGDFSPVADMKEFINRHGRGVIFQLVNPLLGRKSFPISSQDTAQVARIIHEEAVVPILERYNCSGMKGLLKVNGQSTSLYHQAVDEAKEIADQKWPPD